MFNNVGKAILAVFILLFMFTVPVGLEAIPSVSRFQAELWEGLANWTGHYILRIPHPYTAKLVSDSSGLYIHLLNLVLLSGFIVIACRLTGKGSSKQRLLNHWFFVVLSYYLSWQLFEYGFSKIFKWQFYLPEPNTLFTPVGNTYRDLMYWTTMGLSRPYTIFTGVIELLAAVSLLFRRTRFIASLVAFAVLINIVAINFSYDISVKVMSCFLMLVSAVLLYSFAGKLPALFYNRKGAHPELLSKHPYQPVRRKYYLSVKIIMAGIILFATLASYFKKRNFNDDAAARPALHGAYDVKRFIINGDTMPPLLTDTLRWRRVFIHRRGYFIVQYMDDSMQDYALLTDTVKRELIIEDAASLQQYKIQYSKPGDDQLTLLTEIAGDRLKADLQAIDLKKLPALQREFNWTSDKIRP